MYEAYSSLVDDVDRAASTARRCWDQSPNSFVRAGCELRFGWDFAVAEALFATRVGVELASDLVGALLNLIETAQWAEDAVSGARDFINAEKTLIIRAAPPAQAAGQLPAEERSGRPADTPPAAPGIRAPNPQPPEAPAAHGLVSHYDCVNDNSDIGRYVPAGRYWENDFVARGATVTGGWVLIGAADDGADHRARVGIYTGTGRARPLAEIELSARGYDGESFEFPKPITVDPGQRLWVAVSGIGDFTAYDNQSGCFIARVNGYE
ncbi:hypothetical protein AB0J80_11810 [Actinoplanes sp. NPDC049548]|uniref:hypothetical protein n=1 Tax=Actinoplanes sp. NPDC049548 TaxID=3155152 RepID=UPI003431F846